MTALPATTGAAGAVLPGRDEWPLMPDAAIDALIEAGFTGIAAGLKTAWPTALATARAEGLALGMAGCADEVRAAIAEAEARGEADENEAYAAGHAEGRAASLAELDAAITRLHAINAAGYIDDEDHPADWTPPLHLAFQPWARGTWRVALDDGRHDPPDMARDTPTEALTALAAGLDAALDHEARLYAALDAGEADDGA